MTKILTSEKKKPLFDMNIMDKCLKHLSNIVTSPTPLDFFSFVLPLIKEKDHSIFKAIEKISSNGASYLPNMIRENLTSGYIQRKEYQKKTGVFMSPLLALTLLNDCNLSCEGCFAAGYKKGGSIKEDELRVILHFFQNNGARFFVILGGEPLVYKNLIQILSEFNKSIFFLYTNGTLFNKNIFSGLKEAKNIIPMISVDGKETTTDLRRGKGVYKKVIKTIQGLVSEQIPYGVSFTLSRFNFDELLNEKYLQIFESDFLVLATYIQYMDMANSNNIPCSNNMDNTLSEDMKKEAAKVIKGYRRKKTYIIGNIPQDEIDLWGGCPAAGKGILHVNANTDIEPCIFTHFSNTNLKALDFDFDKALRNNYLQAVRKDNCKACLAQTNHTRFHEINEKFGVQQTENIISK